MASTTQPQGSRPEPAQQQGDVQTARTRSVGNTQQEQGMARPPEPGSAFQTAQGAADRLAKEATASTQRAAEKISDTSHRAAEAIDQTRRRAVDEVASQRSQLGGRIRQLGDALRSSGSALQASDASIASLLDRASEQAERIAGYVEHADPRGVANDLTRFARERPVMFYGAAFVAGLALGRFARSSAEAAEPRALEARPTYPLVEP